MDNWIEITGMAWLCMLRNARQCIGREQVGQAEKIYYHSMGCKLMKIKQPNAATPYYIQDINT